MSAFLGLLFAATLAAYYYFQRRRAARVPTPRPIPTPVEVTAPEPLAVIEEPAVATSPILRLQQLGDPLSTVGDASSHPRDIAEQTLFVEAVDIFENQVDLSVLTDYISGASWMLSAAACAALVNRDDRDDARHIVLAGFKHLRPWPIYYVLRYLDSLPSPPRCGALVLRAEEWWTDHAIVLGALTEHFATRRDKGEMASFDNELGSTSPERLTRAETLLNAIADPMAGELLDLLEAFKRSRIDRTFLMTVGRFPRGDSSRQLLVEHQALTDAFAQAEACINHLPPRSLLVIGEPRSGKSSFLSLLAMRAERQGWTVFEAGGPQLQAGQIYIGALEERIGRIVAELALEKRVLWHVPDFSQIVDSGTHSSQTASMLDQLLPAIISGRLLIVSEATPTVLSRALQDRPSVRTAFDLVRMRTLTDAETAALASQVATRVSAAVNLTVDDDVVETVAYLARHYMGGAQMPGAVLDLIKQATQRSVARDAARVTRDDALTAVAQVTGMPKQVLDDRERVDLTALRAFFSARVIGQHEAVDTVVDRIAMLKAGLTDGSKPVAVFLFAGPTGTGKTELAKALAEFLFGSADRLVRLDMSEFQAPDSLRKIVGDPGAGGSRALTDLVRKQPFSVVLLDEFEKAHPAIWDLFLQVFDDGRLTDANGHTVDFRHTIVIMTSNVGSTIKEDSGPGFVAQGMTLSADKVRKAIDQSFRPEFINRIDRIIVFRALTRADMRQIVAKELARVLERRGLRNREWAVEWEPSALEFLLDKGFSPTLGARPLKRAIDQHLLSPLAATLVEHRFPEGDQFLFVRSDGRALQVEFVDPDASATPEPKAEGMDAPAGASGLTLQRMMLHPQGVAAESAALVADARSVERELEGERWMSMMSTLAVRMEAPDFWHLPDRQQVLSRFEVMDRVKAAAATATGLAARLSRPESSSGSGGRYSRDLVARLASQLFIVRHGIDDVVSDAAVEVVLTVQPVLEGGTKGAESAESAEWCDQLGDMYRAWAVRRGMRLAEVTSGAGIPALARSRPLFLISGFGASRLLQDEIGLHVLDHDEAGDTHRAVARVIVAPSPAVLPDGEAEQFTLLSAALTRVPVPSAVVRRYQIDSSPLIRDLKHGWRTGRVDQVFDGNFDLMREG